MRNQPRTPSDDIRDAINERTTERDHAKLRELIASYVRQTGHRVLACGEMTYQVPMAKEGDWTFEVDETSGPELWSRLERIHQNPVAAREKVRTVMAGVQKLQHRMVEAVRAAAG
jgi:hypothetical protein